MSGRRALMMAMAQKEPYFTIDLNITSDNLQFGVLPYWHTGGYCNIVDWGDGSYQAAINSGTALTHTYAEAGTYKVKVRGDMHRFRVGSTNPAAVTDCNGNWEALGNITDGCQMFQSCGFTGTSFTQLPAGLTNGDMMFQSCGPCSIKHGLPVNLASMSTMFNGSGISLEFIVDKLPNSLTSLYRAFRLMKSGQFDFDSITENAPANGWSLLTDLEGCFCGEHTYDYENSTGSLAQFMHKLPNVAGTGGFIFYGFRSSNCAVTLFGEDDYFEITLTTTAASQVWGFTATSDAGRWYFVDWGDNSETHTQQMTKNSYSFTSGSKVSHTFATPGTYHIKLATAPCTIVFDPYDSDNGNYAALGQ